MYNIVGRHLYNLQSDPPDIFLKECLLLIWHLSDINLRLDSYYVCLLSIVHRSHCGLLRVSPLKAHDVHIRLIAYPGSVLSDFPTV